MTDAELKAELDNDPLGLGYAGLRNSRAAALINTTIRTETGVYRNTDYGVVRRWATENGVLIRAQRRVDDGTETDELLGSICKGFLDGDRDRIFAVRETGIVNMADYLHSVGFFGTTYGTSDAVNDTRRTELLQLGGSRLTRAEELWGLGSHVRKGDVKRVRASS